MSGSRRVPQATRAHTGPAAGAASLAERVRLRRAARRRRLALGLARALLVLLPLAALAWVLLASSWLALDRVEVSGTQRLTAAEIRAAAGVAVGTPLARVDTSRIESRIARLAPVATVSVHRSWPSTLQVSVTERSAAAGVLTASGVRLVDPSGVVFAGAPKLPAGVVRLQVNKPGPDDPSTRAALAVHDALPAPLRSRVRIVRAASPSAVVLLLDTGKQVFWGAPGDTRGKALAALALLRLPGTVYDVSAPGLAVRR